MTKSEHYSAILKKSVHIASFTMAPWITIAIRLRYDYDTTTWYDEKLTYSFFARVESRRMEAGAHDMS